MPTSSPPCATPRAAGPLAALLAAVLPVSCAGCGRPDTPLCPPCARVLAVPAWPAAPLGPVATTVAACPPTWSAQPYAGVLRGVVVAWKDRGRLDLVRALAPLLSFAVAGALAGVLPGALAGAPAGAPAPGRVLLVPVPSTRRAVRARGQDVVAALARRAARQLAAAGIAVEVAPVLRSTHAVRDQVGLSAHERAQNLHGAHAVPSRARLGGRWCLLVDDVVTTGASLAEARRALVTAGAHVVAAATLAAAARRPGAGPPAPRALASLHGPRETPAVPGVVPVVVTGSSSSAPTRPRPRSSP